MATTTTDVCRAEKTTAVQCVGMDTTGSCSTCGIQMETIGTIFPAEIKQGFAQTQAYAVPGTPEYCTMSEQTICAGYESSYSCCCQDALAAWQNCIVEKELSVNMNIEPPCTVSCASGTKKGDGGSSLGLIVGIVVVLLVIIGGGVGGFFFYRRRRRAKAIDQYQDNMNDEDDNNDNNNIDKKNWKDYLFCFRHQNDNDKTSLSISNDDVDNYDARAIDEFEYEDEDDNHKNKKKGNKMKKKPNSKKKMKNTKKEKSGGNSSHSKTVTDIEEGFSTRSLSNNDEGRGGEDYDEYSHQDHQEQCHQDDESQLSMSPEQVPSKSYRMKLSNNDDDYDDDDNYNNGDDYVEGNNNDKSMMSREVSVRSARDRKHDIESWNDKNRKEDSGGGGGGGGSNNRRNSARSIKTLESDISTLGYDNSSEIKYNNKSRGIEPQQGNNIDNNRNNINIKSEQLSSKQRLPKKISSRELKSIMRDREESSRRLILMENEMDDVTAKLDEKDRVTEELRRQKLDNDRRIEELEAQNKKLQLELSGSKRNLGSMNSTSDHDRGSSSNRYSSRRSNRSQASMRVVHMNGEQGDDDYDEDILSGSDNDNENEKFDKNRSVTRTPSSRSMRSSAHRSKSRERLSRDTNNENKNMDKSRSVTRTPSSKSMRSSAHRSKSRERLSRNVENENENMDNKKSPPSRSLSRRSSSRERLQRDVDDDRQAASKMAKESNTTKSRSASRSKSSRDPATTTRTPSSRRNVTKVRSGSGRALEQSSSHSRRIMNNSSRVSSRKSSPRREDKY